MQARHEAEILLLTEENYRGRTEDASRAEVEVREQRQRSIGSIMARKATLEDNLKEIELDAKAKDPFGIQDTA